MKKLTLLLLCFLFVGFLSAQVVDSMLHVYAENFPQEKIYTHFDKSVYRAGESIWFKAYVFDGFSPSLNSHNFYAELVDSKGNIVQRKIYPISEACASGFFDIAESLPATTLTFRGYTSWMLNYDTAFFFQKELTILTKNGEATSIKPAADTASALLSFFPEGGNLVEGLTSVLAFKANDRRGFPVNVSGKIVDSKGADVVTFKSQHDGMGSVSFTPSANETYRVVWKDDKGREQTTALPQAQASGAVLSAYSLNGKVVFTIARSQNAPASFQQLYLVGHMAQERVYRARVALETAELTSGMIPVKELPSGVLQLTLFSSDWQPVAERIILVNNNNYNFAVDVTTPEVNTNKRAKNVVEIDVADTLLSNMSLAITDAALDQPVHSDNIISRMLLTGDIKGYVHQPAYYFSNNSDSVAKHLDLVMLTHGWRRYNWDMLVNKRLPKVKYPKDSYLSLQAKVFGISPDRIGRDEQILAILQTKDSTKQFFQMRKVGTDQFVLSNIIFYDTAKVFYQFVKRRELERQATILMENNFYKGYKIVDVTSRPYYVPPTEAALSRSKVLAQEMAKYSSSWKAEGNVLQAVTVRTRAKSRLQEMDERYTSGMFTSGDGYSFDMTDPTVSSGSLDALSFLRGRVAGLQISGDGSSITWRGASTALFLNEMQVDADQISTIAASDIAYIKVYRPPFFGATGGGAGGAIAVYLKKGNDEKVNTAGAGLSRSQVVGYSTTKEFYSPNYSSRSASTDVVADYRTTLYWQPYILTDSSRKKVTVEFYNNDISKAFRIILEGVNEVGKLVHIEKVVQQ